MKLKEVSKIRWSGVIRACKFLRYFWYIIRIVYSVLGGSEEQTNCLTATGRSDGASQVSLKAEQLSCGWCRWHHRCKKRSRKD